MEYNVVEMYIMHRWQQHSLRAQKIKTVNTWLVWKQTDEIIQ